MKESRVKKSSEYLTRKLRTPSGRRNLHGPRIRNLNAWWFNISHMRQEHWIS